MRGPTAVFRMQIRRPHLKAETLIAYVFWHTKKHDVRGRSTRQLSLASIANFAPTRLLASFGP